MQDVRRILEATQVPKRVVCVEPDEAAAKILKSRFSGAEVYSGTAAATVEQVRAYGPFDLIVSNMTAHYVVGVRTAPVVFKELENLLAPEGVWFASYVDVPSIKTSGMVQWLRTVIVLHM